MLWQREISPETNVWLRRDGRLVIDEDLTSVGSGEPVRGAAPVEWVAEWAYMYPPEGESGPYGEPDYPYARLWGGQLVVGRDEYDGGRGQPGPHGWPLRVAAADPVSGAVVWQRTAPPHERQMWLDWFRGSGQCLETIVGEARRHLAVLDPQTWSARWSRPWDPFADTQGQHPAATACAPDGDVLAVVVHAGGHSQRRGHWTQDPAGSRVIALDEATGAELWRVRVAAGWRVSRCGISGRFLILCTSTIAPRPEGYDEATITPVPSAGAPADEPDIQPCPCCCCAQPVAGRQGRWCAQCGKLLVEEVRIEVRDKTTGTLTWRHHFPWPYIHTEPQDSMVVHPDVLVTREHSFLRGRDLATGRVLWSAPVPRLWARSDYPVNDVDRTLPPGTPFSHGEGFPGPMARRARWAWLNQADIDARPMRHINTFVHTGTGRSLTLPGAFHQTEDDLVLTRTRHTLACIALPR